LLSDPKAAEAFTKRYGVLSHLYMDKEDPDGRKFAIDSVSFSIWHDELTNGWRSISATTEEEHSKGSVASIIEIEGYVEEGFNSDVVVAHGYVQLRPKDLWASICLLFLCDGKTGKLGFCHNPSPAPYFKKKRKTQKFCEAGPCVAYAQRQYSLDWWNRVGKRRREKKAKTQHKRSRA
jgi:hypothetical protein